MADEEQDNYKPLMVGGAHRKPEPGPFLTRTTKVIIAVGVATAAIVVIAVAIAAGAGAFKNKQSPLPPLNVIFMVSDGFGPSGETMARVFADKAKLLPLDYRVIGSSITYSSNSIVTDSAAGATAFSCALKTYNYAVAVEDSNLPCATLLEAAKVRGMATGAVVTSRITHATPAAFTSHALNREQEWLIAEQQASQGFDLLFGGGLCEFQPNAGATAGVSCRPDSRDVLATARAAGYQILTNMSDFTGPVRLPVLGLLAPSHMPYEIDRDPAVYPSLLNMTLKALDLISKSPAARAKGFMMLIEGSEIDFAGHANDPAAHVRETLMYQQTVQAVFDFAAQTNTIVISTSDHETGGLTLATTAYFNGTATYPYTWYPEVLAAASHSCDYVAAQLRANPTLTIASAAASMLGMTNLTPDELAPIEAARADPNSGYALAYSLSKVLSYRARIGWTTHGHTGEDVYLYAYGPGIDTLRGVNQNTGVGQFVADVLGFDLPALTPSVRAKFNNLPPYNATSWPNDGSARAVPPAAKASADAAAAAVAAHGHS